MEYVQGNSNWFNAGIVSVIKRKADNLSVFPSQAVPEENPILQQVMYLFFYSHWVDLLHKGWHHLCKYGFS